MGDMPGSFGPLPTSGSEGMDVVSGIRSKNCCEMERI